MTDTTGPRESISPAQAHARTRPGQPREPDSNGTDGGRTSIGPVRASGRGGQARLPPLREGSDQDGQGQAPEDEEARAVGKWQQPPPKEPLPQSEPEPDKVTGHEIANSTEQPRHSLHLFGSLVQKCPRR